jgi:hypothetical protein
LYFGPELSASSRVANGVDSPPAPPAAACLPSWLF